MGPPPVFFGWALCSSPEAGLVLSSAHRGPLTSRCLTDAANLPTSFFSAGALLSVSLVSGLAAHSNPLGNVKTLLQGPQLRPVKSEAPGTGPKQQVSKAFQMILVCGQEWESLLGLHPSDQPPIYPQLLVLGSSSGFRPT